MKPVNINCQLSDGVAFDEDVAFAKEVFEMPEPVSLIGPVALTPAKLEQQMRGPEVDYEPRLVDAYAKLSAGRDLLVLKAGAACVRDTFPGCLRSRWWACSMPMCCRS